MKRVIPPIGPKFANPHVCSDGISYGCPTGSTLDVPDHIGNQLAAAGWLDVTGQHGPDTCGSTTARPENPFPLRTFLDTTLGYIVIFDGLTWRNPATGAAV